MRLERRDKTPLNPDQPPSHDAPIGKGLQPFEEAEGDLLSTERKKEIFDALDNLDSGVGSNEEAYKVIINYIKSIWQQLSPKEQTNQLSSSNLENILESVAILHGSSGLKEKGNEKSNVKEFISSVLNSTELAGPFSSESKKMYVDLLRQLADPSAWEGKQNKRLEQGTLLVKGLGSFIPKMLDRLISKDPESAQAFWPEMRKTLEQAKSLTTNELSPTERKNVANLITSYLSDVYSALQKAYTKEEIIRLTKNRYLNQFKKPRAF